ncbi:unnamed protein product [Periconia digitata]|uniref:Uncharacterized protein n=1 Tax=Periconia digitata TaxID=1303443 RepID=A0A9W4UB38_9PLEO|nr:unnamed protein product [Periconia digitata]
MERTRQRCRSPAILPCSRKTFAIGSSHALRATSTHLHHYMAQGTSRTRCLACGFP